MLRGGPRAVLSCGCGGWPQGAAARAPYHFPWQTPHTRALDRTRAPQTPFAPAPKVHAENGDAVAEGQRRVFEAGVTGPEGHALSRPAVLEAEATGRAVRLAAWVGVPLYVVHVMSAGAADEARSWGGGGRLFGLCLRMGGQPGLPGWPASPLPCAASGRR